MVPLLPLPQFQVERLVVGPAASGIATGRRSWSSGIPASRALQRTSGSRRECLTNREMTEQSRNRQSKIVDRDQRALHPPPVLFSSSCNEAAATDGRGNCSTKLSTRTCGGASLLRFKEAKLPLPRPLAALLRDSSSSRSPCAESPNGCVRLGERWKLNLATKPQSSAHAYRKDRRRVRTRIATVMTKNTYGRARRLTRPRMESNTYQVREHDEDRYQHTLVRTNVGHEEVLA